MGIKSIKPDQAGLAAVKPKCIYIDTDDTLATVLTTGYLNSLVKYNNITLDDYDMALVTTKTSPSASVTSTGWLEVSHVGNDWSLIPTGSPGTVILPTIANHIATYTNTTGTLSEDPATAITGGNLQAGLSGTAGTVSSFPGTAASGSLSLAAVTNSSGNFPTTISNAGAILQTQVISIPDAGANTANFLLSKSINGQVIGASSSAATNSGNFNPLNGVLTLTNSSVTANSWYAIAGNTSMIGNSGAGVGGVSGQVTATGTLSGSSLTAGLVASLNLVGATINGGIVSPLYSSWTVGATTTTNMTNTHGLVITNPSANVLNSQLYMNGDAQYGLEVSGAATFVTTPGGATPSGNLRAIKVYINGAAYLLLAATTYS